jgi:hypothetical protein
MGPSHKFFLSEGWGGVHCGRMADDATALGDAAISTTSVGDPNESYFADANHRRSNGTVQAPAFARFITWRERGQTKLGFTLKPSKF